jgi:putative transposase
MNTLPGRLAITGLIEEAVLGGARLALACKLPPSQIVPRLADQSRYIGSESTIYRVLRDEGQLAHRRVERRGRKRSKPRALCATEPNQLLTWDISYLPTTVHGLYFYL